jgi:hypothetical protein
MPLVGICAILCQIASRANAKGQSEKLALFLVTALIATSLFAANASERKFIHDGMTEGEVLVKIGKPDRESDVSGGGAVIAERKWTYLPAPGDQQTVTTITIREGKVTHVERQVIR